MSFSEYGLGRLVAPDERDSRFLSASIIPASDRNSRFWYGYSYWLDQGPTPECVAYSWSHFLTDSPTTHKPEKLLFTPDELYNLCKQNDEFPGEDYDGTSVRAGAKVLLAKGAIKEYRWAHSVDEVANAILEVGPVVVGTHWYSKMFTPVNGFLIPEGDYEGGHAYKLDGVNKAKKFFRMKNSWGRGWGNNGFARISFDTFSFLLLADGEACVPIE